MYVADFKARSPSVQSARSKRRQSSLVRQLAQRIGLVHYLAQLSAPEEKVDAARHALRVDQVRYPQGLLAFLHRAHSFLHGLTKFQKPLANFAAGQFVNSPKPAITQMVDIVNLAFVIPQPDYVIHRIDKILGPQRHLGKADVLPEFAVQPEPANLAQPVPVYVKELLIEKLFGLLLVGRVTGPQPDVKLQQRLVVTLAIVFRKRIEHQRITRPFGYLDFLYLALLNNRNLVADLCARLYDYLAAFGINDVTHHPHIRRQLVLLYLFGLVEPPDYLFGLAEIGA